MVPGSWYSRPMATTIKNTSFAIDTHLHDFIRDQVDGGGYRSASEVMREALTRFADEKRKEEALLAALDHGVASGRAAPGVFERLRSGASGARQKKRRASR